MTVSNEDRKAVVAINELAAAADILSNTTCHHWLNHDIACDPCRIDALIAHGWGPRPCVSPMKLGGFIDQANAGGMAVPWRGLQDYLSECGIEVSG